MVFIQENAFENVVGQMASILFRPRYIKRLDDFTTVLNS